MVVSMIVHDSCIHSNRWNRLESGPIHYHIERYSKSYFTKHRSLANTDKNLDCSYALNTVSDTPSDLGTNLDMLDHRIVLSTIRFIKCETKKHFSITNSFLDCPNVPEIVWYVLLTQFQSVVKNSNFEKNITGLKASKIWYLRWNLNFTTIQTKNKTTVERLSHDVWF